MSRRTAAAVTALSLSLLAWTAPARAQEGQDFKTELALLHRVVACAESGAVVPPAWVKVVDEHCRALAVQTAGFRKRYVDRAMPFLTKLRPEGAPTTVVYPF